jgi:cytochrome c oxidase subunit 3
MAQAQNANVYYVPHSSPWPIVGAIALFTTMLGVASWLNEAAWGKWVFFAGLAAMLFMLSRWFADVIGESVGGLYNKQVDTSFRMGMVWFIFSEVMFFAAFFGALFYARMYSVPWLGGEGDGASTHQFLWSSFDAAWPSNGPADIGGEFKTIPAWGIPLLNTLLLLASGVTLTIAHHALKAGHRKQLLLQLALTVALGATFMYFQVEEYVHAYGDLNLDPGLGDLRLNFFHADRLSRYACHARCDHVDGDVVSLCAKGHFDRDNHFAFEAVAWYWHFVDVVWLLLFLFVYVL